MWYLKYSSNTSNLAKCVKGKKRHKTWTVKHATLQALQDLFYSCWNTNTFQYNSNNHILMYLPLQEHFLLISVVNTVNSWTLVVYFKNTQLYVKQCQLQYNACVLLFWSPFRLLERRKEKPAVFLKKMQYTEAAWSYKPSAHRSVHLPY